MPKNVCTHPCGKDDPKYDNTLGAHPAWVRGEKAGCEAIIVIVNGILDGKVPIGSYAAPELNAMAVRLRDLMRNYRWREEISYGDGVDGVEHVYHLIHKEEI